MPETFLSVSFNNLAFMGSLRLGLGLCEAQNSLKTFPEIDKSL